MYTALVVLAIIVCVLLALIILVQNPKGGGLASGFSGSNNIMGVQRTGDVLEKGTWALAITLLVLSLLINVTIPKGGTLNQDATEIQKQIQKPAGSPSQFGPAPGTQPKPTDTSKR
ncbi:MAG TPA: preprotein translocase subunit SecG [Sphingobacteriaceae bacterium]|nr:preprotein translocase subunit SecG [Sphingobacteriaceae bacterium]